MELYHFTTTKGYETIESQGRLYLASPNTDLDRKANESINVSPFARYVSFSESDSFLSGYPGSREDRDGVRIQYRIGIDTDSLNEQGRLIGPVDYIGQMSQKYISENWNSGYIKYLRSKGVIRSDKSIDNVAKKKLNEQEYRFFSDRPFIDLKKCKVTVYAKEGGYFKPHWGDKPSKDIKISDSTINNVASIVATILLADISPKREGAKLDDVELFKNQIEALKSKEEELRAAAENEKRDLIEKQKPRVKYVEDVQKLMRNYPKFLGWFNSDFQEPSYTNIGAVQRKIEVINKALVDEYKQIVKRFDRKLAKLNGDLTSVDSKRDEAIVDLTKQVADLNLKSQYRYSSDEASQKIKEHIGKYVSNETLKNITNEAVQYLGRFEEEGRKGVFSKLDQSYRYIVGIENRLPNKELLIAIEDWIVEAYKEYGSEHGSYEKLRKAKSEMLEQKLIVKMLLPVIDKSLTKTLSENFVEEGMSGTAIAPTSVISSENREKLSTLYQDLRSQLDKDFNIQFNQSHILIKVKYPGDKELDYSKYSQDDRLYESEEEVKQDFDYAKNMAALIKFMKNEGMQIEPLPEIILNKEKQKDGLLDATGNYDPREKKLVVYGNGRHPKDVLRSFSHEMSHHEQNLQNKIGNVDTDQVSDSESLEELEGEAYRRGNLIFRKWTESLKK